MTPAGTIPEEVTDPGFYGRVSPDGERVAYIRGRWPKSEIWVGGDLRAAGGVATPNLGIFRDQAWHGPGGALDGGSHPPNWQFKAGSPTGRSSRFGAMALWPRVLIESRWCAGHLTDRRSRNHPSRTARRSAGEGAGH